MYLAVHLCTLYDQFLAHTREDEAVLWLVMVRAASTAHHWPALRSTAQLVSGRNLVAAGHWAAVWAPLVRPGHRAPGLQSAHTNLPLLYSGVEIRP